MLSEQLRTLRTRQGLSQQALAEQLHVVRQTVSKWEQGRSVPDATTLPRLAEVLHTSVPELLELDTPADPSSIQAQVEQLQAQLRRGAVLRRRRGFLVLTLVALLLSVGSLVLLGLAGRELHLLQQTAAPIIGGGDAATQIYVTSLVPDLLLCMPPLVLLAVGLIGLRRTYRK